MTWEHEGSVSFGTLREADLIPAFFAALAKIDPERAAGLAREHEFNPELWMSWIESTGPDAWDEFLCELDSALNDAAPSTHYFGTVEGDGADFGFWPVGD